MKGSFSLPTASRGSQRALVLVLMLCSSSVSGVYFIGQKFAATKTAVSGLTQSGWIAFSPERLQSELATGRTVFVDFTAAWCITCKYNEAYVLEERRGTGAFQQRGVVKMKADWTNADP